MLKLIGEWNPERQIWERDNPRSGRLEPFSETWPKSGMTRTGVAFELPTSVHATKESACSSLPTPRASDHKGSMTAPSARNHVNSGYGTLPEVVGAKLLPTPRTSDGTGGESLNMDRAERMDDLGSRLRRINELG